MKYSIPLILHKTVSASKANIMRNINEQQPCFLFFTKPPFFEGGIKDVSIPPVIYAMSMYIYITICIFWFFWGLDFPQSGILFCEQKKRPTGKPAGRKRESLILTLSETFMHRTPVYIYGKSRDFLCIYVVEYFLLLFFT